jgi:putative restriction endonuclease
MRPQKINELFEKISIWKSSGQRAPHKPLLLLYALGQYQQGNKKLSFKDLDKPLTDLLIRFGPNRKAYHSEYPFWRLQNDSCGKLWVLDNAELCEARLSNTDAKKSELLNYNVIGYFHQSIQDAFDEAPSLIKHISEVLLESHFPNTWHEEILEATGISLGEDTNNKKTKRDPQFRELILTAYQFRCAICDIQVQLGQMHPILEAAHIKWHQAKGPDIENNGIALCCFHHKLFDRGAITISLEHEVLVSENLFGNNGLSNWVLDFNGKSINKPVRSKYEPKKEYILWHQKEVFQGRPREIRD